MPFLIRYAYQDDKEHWQRIGVKRILPYDLTIRTGSEAMIRDEFLFATRASTKFDTFGYKRILQG